MKKTVSRVIVLIVVIAICVGITACKNDPEFTYESKEPKSNMVISAISPKEGENIVLLNDEMAEFMKTYERGAADNFYVGTEEDHFAPKVVTLSWKCNKPEKPEYFVVEYATNIKLENSLKVVTFETSVDVTNLFANSKYYWQVSAYFKDNVVKSSIFTFKTADTVRTVTIDGVRNSRDIGGVMTESGKRLKQGMVYRSAIIAGKVTDVGKDQAVRELGIKSELDLTTNTPGKSQLGDQVKYIPVSGYYYDNFVKSGNWKKLANEFRAFADPDNYPILFHCAIGRDRTGCLAATLEALCGVPEELIYRDYETSFFSGACTGEQSQNEHFPSQMLDPQLDVVMKTIKNYGAIAESENPSLAECTEIFLKVGLQLTQEEIDTIREMMIED